MRWLRRRRDRAHARHLERGANDLVARRLRTGTCPESQYRDLPRRMYERAAELDWDKAGAGL